MNHSQYRVANPTTPEMAAIFSVIREVGTKHGFAEETEQSLAPDTLVFFRQADRTAFRVELGARRMGSDVLVDAGSGWGPPDKFSKEVARDLGSLLKSRLGSNRVTSVPLSEIDLIVTNKAEQGGAGNPLPAE